MSLYMTGNTIKGNPGEYWTRSVRIPSRREAGTAGTEVGEMQVRTEEVLVRKVIALELVSVDGVMERPEEWAFSYADDEMNEANAAGMAASDAMLLGRVTYEGLAAFWPNQPAGTPMVDYINSVPKFVVSKTLDEPLGWNNSALVEGDVAEGVAGLKRWPGKDITIIGSGALVRSLLEEGLLDELRLMVHPVILGSGKRLFEDRVDPVGLTLVDSKTFTTGVVSLAYRPSVSQGAPSTSA
jgi:dihydrofolate reductase